MSGTPEEKHAVGVSIKDAFKSSGFVYLKNHGIPPSTVSKVFSSFAGFFARPQAQKDSLCFTTPQARRGYLAIGKEKLTQPSEADGVGAIRASAPDLKETMEIGRDDQPEFPNRWPDQIDAEGKEFTTTMQSFFESCRTLHMRIMQALALGLNFPEHFFDEFVDAGDNNLRLLHYPPVSKDVFRKNPAQVRAGEHTDYGSVTLLFQDERGGLQVRAPGGSFVDVRPIADTIVVNAGDLLARWSNDLIKSTRHRVVEPPSSFTEVKEYPARYSIGYFCNPNVEAFIEALPGTYGEEIGVPKRYSGIKTEDYLVQRFSATT